MPGYEQKAFGPEEKRGRLRLVASPDGDQGSVSFSADAKIYAGLFDQNESAELAVEPGRLVYVHLAKGELTVNGQALKAGDALKMVDEPMVQVSQGQDAEVLVFDLAA
jgi:redox-sensitive bicupin YhaK (pirin superfamily)